MRGVGRNWRGLCGRCCAGRSAGVAGEGVEGADGCVFELGEFEEVLDDQNGCAEKGEAFAFGGGADECCPEEAWECGEFDACSDGGEEEVLGDVDCAADDDFVGREEVDEVGDCDSKVGSDLSDDFAGGCIASGGEFVDEFGVERSAVGDGLGECGRSAGCDDRFSAFDDCGCGDESLKAPSAAALAGVSADVDDGVSDFASHSAAAGVELAAGNQASADAGAQGDYQNVLVLDVGFLPLFVHGGEMQRAVDSDGYAEFAFEDGPDGDVFPLGHVGRREQNAVVAVDESREGDADAEEELAGHALDRGAGEGDDLAKDVLRGVKAVDGLLVEDDRAGEHVGEGDSDLVGFEVDGEDAKRVGVDGEHQRWPAESRGLVNDAGDLVEELLIHQCGDDAGDGSGFQAGFSGNLGAVRRLEQTNGVENEATVHLGDQVGVSNFRFCHSRSGWCESVGWRVGRGEIVCDVKYYIGGREFLPWFFVSEKVAGLSPVCCDGGVE